MNINGFKEEVIGMEKLCQIDFNFMCTHNKAIPYQKNMLV